MTSRRNARQLPLLGVQGQERLSGARVLVIGVGGLGSHVVQQLAYLGIGALTALDHDVVDETSLNRLIGAGPEDAARARPKVDVLADLVAAANPEVRFRGVCERFPSPEGLALLPTHDFVFGCVDREGARLILTEATAIHGKPYLDVATEVLEGPPLSWGGRLFLTRPGGPCLVCTGELDIAEAGRDLETGGEAELRRRIYGMPASELGGSGPSVVTLNGVLASLAVTEFLAHVTGLREPHTMLVYRGETLNRSPLTRREVALVPGCYYCAGRAGGDPVALQRYLVGHGPGKAAR
jgi:molybdopterin-synthase adenylyltransferase